MANQHGKAAAAAIIEILNGRRPEPPTMVNTCYSFIDDHQAIHVAGASLRRRQEDAGAVTGAGGVSIPDGERWAIEGSYASGWAQTIWADTLS